MVLARPPGDKPPEGGRRAGGRGRFVALVRAARVGHAPGVVRRPNMTLAVKRLVRDVAARVPELSYVRPSRVLVVAGEARRASRATIRPAHQGSADRRAAAGGTARPLVRVKGRTILYVITLRPLWFLASTPEERIATVLHELYHASTRFDGTLHRGRRHSRLPRPRYNRKIPPAPPAVPGRRAAGGHRALRPSRRGLGADVARAARPGPRRRPGEPPRVHREAALPRPRADAHPRRPLSAP